MKEHISRLLIILLWAQLFIIPVSCGGTEQPNVILILTDDQGYGEVASHGNPLIKTPNLDRLSREGIRLEDFHVNNVCSPSRAAILTGRYSARTGVWHTVGGRNIPDENEYTMAELFRDNGYGTFMAGKWHLGDNYPYRPEDRGFDEVFRIGGGGLGQIPDYWGNGLYDGHYWNGKKWIETRGYCTDVQFESAIDYMERKKDSPFFIYLATTAPHSPVGAPAEYVDPYLKMGLSKGVAAFYGMVANIDENVGKLRAYLDENRLAENTLLVFMSDNGSACGKNDSSVYNAGMRGKKGSDYDGGHRVPCFIYWPAGGLSGGKPVDRLTAHLDLMPTFIEACGFPEPEGIDFDGRNLMPLLKDPDTGWEDRVIITEGKVNARQSRFKSSAVLYDNWRLVSGNELFEIRKDPGQKSDLSGQNLVISELLKQKYNAWYDELSPGFGEHYHLGIGNPEVGEVELTAMDLLPAEDDRGRTVTWNQKGVRKGDISHGRWALDIERAGRYRIELHRWPKTAGLSIDEGPEKSAILNIDEGLIRIGEVELRKEYIKGEASIAFELELEKGEKFLEAVFRNSQGEEFSAFYVYISTLY